MTGPMPTRAGDVVVLERQSPARYSVFTVTRHGQQEPDVSSRSGTAFDKHGALRLAEMMARQRVDGGTIFLCESRHGSWTPHWTPLALTRLEA